MAARQWIKLTGLGVDAFDSCATAILEIQQVLSSHLPHQTMQTWSPGTENGHIVLEFSNRYFSDSGICDEDVSITSEIDPLSLLRNRMPSRARHSMDNQVLYYERQTSPQGYVSQYLPHSVSHAFTALTSI